MIIFSKRPNQGRHAGLPLQYNWCNVNHNYQDVHPNDRVGANLRVRPNDFNFKVIYHQF